MMRGSGLEPNYDFSKSFIWLMHQIILTTLLFSNFSSIPKRAKSGKYIYAEFCSRHLSGIYVAQKSQLDSEGHFLNTQNKFDFKYFLVYSSQIRLSWDMLSEKYIKPWSRIVKRLGQKVISWILIDNIQVEIFSNSSCVLVNFKSIFYPLGGYRSDPS